jgi:hypothetical protein
LAQTLNPMPGLLLAMILLSVDRVAFNRRSPGEVRQTVVNGVRPLVGEIRHGR